MRFVCGLDCGRGTVLVTEVDEMNVLDIAVNHAEGEFILHHVCTKYWSLTTGYTYGLSGIGSCDLLSPAQRRSLTAAAGQTLYVSPGRFLKVVGIGHAADTAALERQRAERAGGTGPCVAGSAGRAVLAAGYSAGVKASGFSTS